MLIFAAESSELAEILISEFLVLGIFMFVLGMCILSKSNIR